MNRRLTLPEQILRGFGVVEPGDIDLEAIAWEMGAKVKYRELHGCEARIIGRGDKAIISVDIDAQPRRQRFSVAHELGHWRHHRGRCLICRAEDIGTGRQRSATDPERIADEFASDLLLPRYMLDPMLRGVPRPTMKAVRSIAEAFDASLTATLIKIIETNRYPMMIVCHAMHGGRKWFRASASVPTRWFPRDELDHESSVFSLLYGAGAEEAFPRRVGADAWFDRSEAAHYEVLEQAFALPDQQVCAIITFPDEKMLRER
ncbi:MAG TPA: ImmA/IrrE family metallo-endopeptidase [Parvularculaceae bacterium]|nr:ImmA/IrrE family metallo-endopeptidase [Parvularculaceae bacterium]